MLDQEERGQGDGRLLPVLFGKRPLAIDLEERLHALTQWPLEVREPPVHLLPEHVLGGMEPR